MARDLRDRGRISRLPRPRRALGGPAREAALVAAISALALALRYAGIHQSLFGDELFLYFDVHGRSLGQVLSAVHDTEKTPPLHFILGWLFARGSSAPTLVRVPSLVAGVATVPLVYLLAMRTVGRCAGLVAAAWFALSPFELFYGTEARGYSLVTALVVLSTLALLAALDERRPQWWVLYAVAAGAAIYTHYIAALALVPQAAWALWTHRETAREQLLAGAAVGLAFLPWLPSLVVQVQHSADEARRLALLAPLTLSNVWNMSVESLAGHPFVLPRELPGRGPITALALVLAAAVLLLVREERRAGGWARSRPAERGVLLVLLAITPLIALVLYSLRPHTSFLLARNLSTAVPYALLCLGWLLTRAGPRLAIALSAIALAAVAVGTVKTMSADHQRTDARDAARYLDAHAPPAAPVVDVQYPYKGPPARGTRLYLKRPHPVYELADWLPAWRAATRAHAPLFVSAPGAQTLLRLLAPPPPYGSRYRLVAQHTSPGFRPIVTREYAPR